MKPSMMVKLQSEHYKSEGVYAGDTGVVLELVNGTVKVEFKDTYGYTIATLMLSEDELELAE